MRKVFVIATAAAAAVLTAAGGARADGFFAPRLLGEATKLVASPRQEALLVDLGETVQVTLRTHFRAGPEELAWVVPVPAKPTDIKKSDDAVFESLEERTAPRFYTRPSKGFGLGCHCGRPADEAGGLGRKAVVVEETGTAGIFKYVVLSATEAQELTKWLNDNEYFVPAGAERIFERYVRKGWHWLAMRVRPEESGKPTLAPHPIGYTYEDDKLVYPLMISRLSADQDNEIVLYVLNSHRYLCANWANATIDRDQVKLKAGTPSGTNYEELFEAMTTANQGRVFVTEYAARIWLPLPGLDSADGASGEEPTYFYLTRLRAVMKPEAMDRDVVLVPVASWEWEDVDNTYHLATSERPRLPLAGVAAAAGAVFALLAGLLLVSRGGWPRAVGVMCLVLGAAAVSMI
jgi:hypothetical protein